MIKNRLFFALVLLVATPVFSQRTNISPYSKLSIGDIQGATFSRNFAMGGMGVALADVQYLNPYNPASYTTITWTNFETGLISSNVWLASGNQSQNANITNFSHLSIGFPVTNWWGMGISIMPLSKVGYSYRTYHTLKSNYNDIPYENGFDGSGGLNQINLSNGFRLWKKLSVGFNFSYYFGKMQYQEVQQFTESDDFNNSAWVNTTEASGAHIDFGVQYPFKLRNHWKMQTGLTFTPTQGLRAISNEFGFTYRGQAATSLIIDTISYVENAPFSIVLPPKIGIGVLFNKSDKILTGAELSYTRWSLSNYNTYKGLNDVLSVRIGGEYRIGEAGFKIRLGARYGQVPLKIGGENPKEYAGTAGFTIPFRSKNKLSKTELNIGFEVGQRGKDNGQMILEQYMNVHIGVILNNKWFIKRVYD